jgi:hypothetical protein
MAIAITVDGASNASEPNAITVTGLTPLTQQVVFMRSYGGELERIAGTWTADAGGVVAQPDYLYPFDVPIVYLVYDSTVTTLLAQSAVVAAVDSDGMPWIRDVIFPSLRYSSVRIVDVTGRTRAGRINPYYAVAQPMAITTGDVRSGSTGSLQLYCVSHEDRDTVLFALSTGNPCLLRIPAACQVVIDEMAFAPVDIAETRMGTGGACLLTVDFLEVELSEVGAFQGITYAQQTDNAAAANIKYGSVTPPPSGLSLAFAGKTYRDLALSPTGIAP